MVGRRLSHLLKRGKLSFLGKPLYNALVGAELACVRLRDGKKPFAQTALVDEKLTAVIKTFERPDTLRRLVRSIKKLYPGMHVIVVDDSRSPLELEGVKTVRMPYDSGVSAGRQKALEQVRTPYLLLLDDDFIFYRKTELEPAMQLMETHSQIDIMGGEVVNLPSFKSADYREAHLHPTPAASLFPPGSEIGGVPVYDKVPNFYIARTECLKLVGWDERIKRLDHADFFTRAKGVLATVFNKDLKVLHAQTPFDTAYLKIRHDVRADRTVLYSKFYKNDKSTRRNTDVV